MNRNDIKISADGMYFVVDGAPIFSRHFVEVLKFHAPGLAAVRDESGAYHIDHNGSPLYAQKYTRTFGYYCNRAAVMHGKNWFHINEYGERTYPQNYAWTGNFQEDLCTIRDFDNHYFHIDLHGKHVYTEKYVYAGDFKDGIACVKQENGLFKHIKNNGTLLNNNEFVDLGVFHKNYATAKDNAGWFHIDKNGDALYSERYLMVEPFYNGCALVTKFDGRKIIINECGERLLVV